MKKLSLIAGSAVTISATLLTGLIALAPLAAFAQATITTSADVSAGTSGVSVTASAKGTASVAKAQARADQEIERRITNLNSLSARVADMKNISSTEKASLQASITTEIGNLVSLKATIDADTTLAALKTDLESITKDYRIYMLVIPQGRILAASDRVETIVADMQALSTPLSARITAAQAAGVNVSGAQTAYSDMQAKVSDAGTQASAAVSETASLTPDQGNATVEASNTAAIKDAAAKIKTATADLKAAYVDIKTIEAAVKGTGSTASSTAST